MSRLPSELLSEVFLQALPNNWSSALAGRRPLYLAQVCSRWRDVAHQTPQIWSTIIINDERNPPAECEADILQELARTGVTPITIIIDMANDGEHLIYPVIWPPGSVWKDTERIWDALCAQSHRWTACSLYFLPPSAFAIDRRLSFPHLRHIGLAMNPPNPDMSSAPPLHFFADALGVDSLQLHYCRKPPSPLVIPSAWTLTALSITFNDVIFQRAFLLCRSCMPVIMSSSRTLRLLRLSNEFFGNFPPENEPVHFPALEYLHLEHASIHICRLIIAPNLKGISMHGRSVSTEIPGDEITGFEMLLDRSSGCPSLQHLEIHVLRAVSLTRLLILLERLPRLTYLRLCGGFLSEREHHASRAVLRALTRTANPASRRLLPNLTRLHLDIGQNTAILTEEYMVLLRELLLSRLQPTTATTATATPCAVEADSALAYLRELISDNSEVLDDLPPGLLGYFQTPTDSYGDTYKH
ncbi:hypothetical protein BD626DRAFT_264709 [Schizophyllum amplum]|uniref:F-box domain-containing protein n=1 Tax=Schizophyllum amplum TaxID=97359 RepID=A0A550CGW8_9AGAR|nr:hypothetical protein BD626DRAFT_264709 [Auriculariopsis ampla]